MLDLRSPQIPAGDIAVDIDHAVRKLLVADDAVLDDWDLRRTGRISQGEIRVHRGGVAILSAMCSRAYLADLRRARRLGSYPTVDDPARAVNPPG